MTTSKVKNIVAELMQEGIDPDRILLSGTQFDESVSLWNRNIEHTPAIIVRCTNSEEVQTAVRIAGASGRALSVRGGGHDWAGRALREDGLVIDMTLMRSVEINGDGAVIQGGATNLDVVNAAENAGRTVVAGAVGAVGFTGLTIGGGYGPFVGNFGLAADNMLGAEVVLADGRLVTTDSENNPDLFWALKGGGGNFGVVTSLRVRAHPKTTFQSGLIAFPLEQAREVLLGYATILKDVPDALAADAGMFTVPGGLEVVYITPTWSGEPGEGDGLFRHLAALGTPLMNTVTDTTYSALMRGNDELLSARGNWAMGTRNLPELTPDAIDTLVEIARTRTSPQSIIYWHYLHGAASRVSLADTAFGERRNHFMLELIARWPETDEETAHLDWVREASQALAPHALPGGYANLLGPDSVEQIAHAYGSNAARLLAAKARYDPTGVFTAIPLPKSE